MMTPSARCKRCGGPIDEGEVVREVRWFNGVWFAGGPLHPTCSRGMVDRDIGGSQILLCLMAVLVVAATLVLLVNALD